MLTSGKRTAQHQVGLIKAGLTQARQSRHLDGTAFDVSFNGITREEALRLPAWVWQAVGQAGERLGLRWGGRFQDYDPFHFDAG
ncbi:MAG: M15 family metallopeptidase [Polaromonas sp.]